MLIQTKVSAHVETVVLLSKFHAEKNHVDVKLKMDELDISFTENKVTYDGIKKYVADNNN